MNKNFEPFRYCRYAVSRLMGFTAPLIRQWEEPFLRRYGTQTIDHQPIFIIGAPRTGSTILYQAMTNAYDVIYIDNLAALFHNNLFFGSRLSQGLYRGLPHNSFESHHGRTRGLHSPSECGRFWYRWLPKDRHFIDHNDVEENVVREIKREITAATNYIQKPLLFKNLNAGQRMRLLIRCFPEARFVFITRHPVYVVQSILLAKRRLGLSDDEFWSIMPPNVEELKRLPGIQQVVAQLYYLEKQIAEDSALVSQGNVVTVRYENLSPRSIRKLASKLDLRNEPEGGFPRFKDSNSVSLPRSEFGKIQDKVKELDWGFKKRLLRDTSLWE